MRMVQQPQRFCLQMTNDDVLLVPRADDDADRSRRQCTPRLHFLYFTEAQPISSYHLVVSDHLCKWETPAKL